MTVNGITPEKIVEAVHKASATGRVALTVVDSNGVEKPTNVAECFVKALLNKIKCEVPPNGWHCTRTPGHEGPCAALPVETILTDNESDPTLLWAEIHRLRWEMQGPPGFATWKDAAVDERIRRVKAEKSQPKLVLAIPDYEKRKIIIASDEVVDDERIVCVAIQGSDSAE